VNSLELLKVSTRIIRVDTFCISGGGALGAFMYRCGGAVV